jgi:integrase
VAHWRLARLPGCLSAEEVDRLIAACNGTTVGRLRDRAILLMLARLGLRSGDVAHLRLTDIHWNSGTLQVMGKGRYQVRLPLPQDVGDALLRYLDCRPSSIETDLVFIRSKAPCRPFASGDGVSSVVKHALKRAKIDAPAKGAHLLRHTAATEMLRNGVPLGSGWPRPPSPQHRHDRLLRQGRCRVAQTSRSAVAGGKAMMAAVELPPPNHFAIERFVASQVFIRGMKSLPLSSRPQDFHRRTRCSPERMLP